MFSIDYLNDALTPWVIVIVGVVISAVVLYILKKLIMHRLRKLTSETRYMLDSLMVYALSLPLTVFAVACLLMVVEALLNYTGLLANTGQAYGDTLIKILLIMAVILFVDRITMGFIGEQAERHENFKNSKTILKGISRGIIICIGALVLLGTLGISVTPIVASLGITSLAVALALQPTLENFFSGVQMVIDKPIRVGDFIEIESGEQGFVDKIGWRSTWIRMLPNNTIIMPNSELSNSKIINYFYPEKELSVPVEVGVHYSSDLEHVERVTLEVAREILVSHEWGVDDYETFVVYTAFADSSINFTVMLRAKEYFNRFWVKSAFIKALHKRYAEEGIVIPYPIRALNTRQESATFTPPVTDI
ncbi:mechanosensitive ion channel family protein [Porticoccus litoralis]|uniref:Small-conductance mechanosensitive channel n=1 Tax=Porticoccus litoralis TaxID=434086 RepID=A0AAW8B563_9GAMM|nr:mechanosensitive ion channel family protein [Porticoccus litoralis]MDP1520565.1 mechanosensitive ion channel family protein [Porticoccus litoralis]